MVHGSCAVAPSIILSTRGRTLHQINCFQLWTQSNGRLDRLSTMKSYEQQWILQRPLSRVKSSPQHPQRTLIHFSIRVAALSITSGAGKYTQ